VKTPGARCATLKSFIPYAKGVVGVPTFFICCQKLTIYRLEGLQHSQLTNQKALKIYYSVNKLALNISMRLLNLKLVQYKI
jgi:hypothetical protein